MHSRYSDPEFIAIVSRNLPSPEGSGPQTEAGKQRTRYNALRHGLNVDDILPCRASDCYYAPLCPLLGQVDELPRLCAVELSEYQRMGAVLSSEADGHEYIILSLRYERLLKCRAIDPEIVYQDRFEHHQSRLLTRLMEQQADYRSAEGK